MDMIETRLNRCFALAFPGVPAKDISKAALGVVAGWDSLATLTLVALVEEEFGIHFPIHMLSELTSFESFQNAVIQTQWRAAA